MAMPAIILEKPKPLCNKTTTAYHYLMGLQDDIANWDQKSRQAISDIYYRYHEGENFLPQLVGLIDRPELQRGATWLLKHHLQTTAIALDGDLVSVLYGNINKLANWESKLHILQAMAFLPVAGKYRKAVEYFIRDCLAAENNFVRAWAFNGFYQLAIDFPQYQPEAKKLFDHALTNEPAPSVKARIGNLLKKGF
jgi:hypothetical protein